MFPIEKLLKMLEYQSVQARLIALEKIGARAVASPEIISAIEKATHDENPEVTNAAQRILKKLTHPSQDIDDAEFQSASSRNLVMLFSSNSSDRKFACDQFQHFTKSSPEIINALIAAANDKDAWVASAAKTALQADVHRQMLKSMGSLEPGSIDPNNWQTRGTLQGVDQTSMISKIIQRVGQNRQLTILELAEAATFFLGFFVLITGGSWAWASIFLFFIFIGLEIYGIQEYGCSHCVEFIVDLIFGL